MAKKASKKSSKKTVRKTAKKVARRVAFGPAISEAQLDAAEKRYKAASRKRAKAAANVQYGPAISEAQLDAAQRRYGRKVKMRESLEGRYQKLAKRYRDLMVTCGEVAPPKGRKKKASKKAGGKSERLSDAQLRVVLGGGAPVRGKRAATTPTTPRTTLAGRGRQASAMKVWTCTGPVRSGCGGGKMGGHVVNPVRKSKKG